MIPIALSRSKATRPVHVTVIVNPVSCAGNVEKIRQVITERFAQYDCVLQFVETAETPPARELAKAALAEGAELIVAAGGDGTIMETANALIDGNVPLGIIPLGTGNLLALNLGLPLDINSAIDVIMTGTPRAIDLISVNNGEHYFAIMGGIGFDAKVMQNTEREAKQVFGKLAYIWTALQHLQGGLFRANVQIDEETTFDDEYKSILIANMGLIGPNLSAFPTAKPTDGYMRVGCLKAANVPEFFQLLTSTILEGSPEQNSLFEVHRCKSVRIQLTEPQPIEYDGDSEGTVTHVTATVVPNALNIVMATDAIG